MSDMTDYEAKARNAIKAFWGAKDAATQAQIERGIQDVGSRSAVTAGKHLDAFVPLLRDIANSHGLDGLEFFIGRKLPAIPGYFRPTKEWDLIIMRGKMLVAAFELKSIGSSFGNNMNNRTEEAIGTAHDFWTAFREGAFGKDAPTPFAGWIMIMADCEESTTPVSVSERHFQVFPEFKGASYAQRCDILCRRLIQEKLYTATALMLTPSTTGKQNGDFRHLSDTGSFRRFIATFAGHMTALAVETARG